MGSSRSASTVWCCPSPQLRPAQNLAPDSGEFGFPPDRGQLGPTAGFGIGGNIGLTICVSVQRSGLSPGWGGTPEQRVECEHYYDLGRAVSAGAPACLKPSESGFAAD